VASEHCQTSRALGVEKLTRKTENICELSFETTSTQRVPHKLFRLSDGYKPPGLNCTLRRLMRYIGLLKNEDGQNMTL
jgi:hypothetical protein